MKFSVAAFTVLLCFIYSVTALDLGQSYCLACLETTDRYVYSGIQGACRGTKKDCNVFGANCDYCYVYNLEQQDIDTLQNYCNQGNGANSINPKYKTFRVTQVNMNYCS